MAKAKHGPGYHNDGMQTRSRFRLVAPAGAPLPMRAIVRSALRVSADKYSLAELVQKSLGMRHVFVASSGVAALTILLRVLQQRSGRQEVVIPAYTCYSVPAAVVRAGLAIRLCDVDPKTLDLDLNSLRHLNLNRVLCIIPSGLYGIPGDLTTLDEICQEYDTFLVDDAAQSLGATVGSRPCGTFGAVGFCSLGRGKCVTAMGGGILFTQREDLADMIRQEVGELPPVSAWTSCMLAIGTIIYAMMLRPSRYWILDRIPFLGLGASRFDPSFPMKQLSQYQERLAAQVFPLLDVYNRIRRENAAWLRAEIEGIEGIEVPRPIEGAEPAYLRFPILARDERHRSHLLRRFLRAGIGASISYPTAIEDIPGIQRYLADTQLRCPGARSIARRIITLPTHPYVTRADVEKIGALFNEKNADSC